MFSEFTQNPWIIGTAIALACLVIAGIAMGHFDPFDVEDSRKVGHDAQDSVAEWAGRRDWGEVLKAQEEEWSKAITARFEAIRKTHTDEMRTVCERIASANANIESAIRARVARDDRIMGLKADHLWIDEDGDVDTMPPLTADQSAMLRKIDMVELQVVTSHRWHDRGTPACPAFPIGLIGCGVEVPQPARGEVFA